MQYAGWIAFAALAVVVAAIWLHKRICRRPVRRPVSLSDVDRPLSVVCIDCHGKGWSTKRERTLEFVGDGFADIEQPARMCTACGGSGRVDRRQ